MDGSSRHNILRRNVSIKDSIPQGIPNEATDNVFLTSRYCNDKIKYPVPMHAHIYSNGDICMSSLGSEYVPTASILSFIHSIMSMLSSATEKTLPPDNHIHADLPPGSADARYMYHDDNC
ncbi:bifunctional Ubiquitin-conjugating enzyme E2/Ubiquitin-conjugating enzyme-RWD-like [Babesia duncani]|uniref:Bifunctional Ubiquitin-conjugating enzyme E2/Ubiquitin-conjugating enzyme-RWD-like n=1 Tax=Babesia duncani TaxID=323732 RepID=A0AAD9PIG8_9APIC|nr:bifunctional Ubiquitin-conjugating enzyme E2/Ubiquitin-conjugating enzyme-RWD-like [Babesia duncani]